MARNVDRDDGASPSVGGGFRPANAANRRSRRLGRVGRRAQFLLGEFQIERAAVIGEELNAKPAKDGFEVGHELKLAGTHHASARRREAVKMVGSSGNSLAPADHIAGTRDSTEISHD